jgi:RNA polymerase sigma factor (sigma-70 family)
MDAKLPLSNISDEDLILQYRQTEDAEVLAVLFKRYTHLVLGVCLNILKEKEASKDALMDVFERLFVLLKNQEILNFKAWLYTITRNYCLKKIKTERPHSDIEETKDEYFFMELVDESSLILEEKIENLQTAIAQLKYSQRECVKFFYLEQKTYSDIELLTGYSNNEVKSFIQNGKRNLKILLEGKINARKAEDVIYS